MSTILEITHLNKSYGHSQVLFDISFNCDKGSIIGLVGENGAGKTTIMKAILGLIKKDGEISVNGKRIFFNKNSAIKDAGSLIEQPALYPYLTGLEHLKLFSRQRNFLNSDVKKIIQAFKMDEFLNKKVKNFSLGMRQKLGIALAFLNQPHLIILDEPMNGLDSRSTFNLRKLILEKKQQGVTFLISSHILSELEKVAERVVVIEHGKVIKDCSMQEILEQNPLYLTISTTDNIAASSILKENGYQILTSEPLKIVITHQTDIERIIKTLTSQGINILDINKEQGDLEQSILKILN